jgi:FtsZ-binding cell division protein ZapB
MAELENLDFPMPGLAPFPFLPIFTHGLRCILKKTGGLSTEDHSHGSRDCVYVAGTAETMRNHCREIHGWKSPRPPGGQTRSVRGKFELGKPWIVGIEYQVVLRTPKCKGWSRRLLEVRTDAREEAENGTEIRHVEEASNLLVRRPRHNLGEEKSVLEQMNEMLEEKEHAWQERTRAITSHIDQITDEAIRRTPWLDLTLWLPLFRDINLREAARLIEPPLHFKEDEYQERGDDESILRLILSTFEDIIEDVRSAIVDGRVNPFALHRANSFSRGRQYHFPVYAKLRDGTYKGYIRVWKLLFCFVFHSVYKRRPPQMGYTVTEQQSIHLDHMISTARTLLSIHTHGPQTFPEEVESAQKSLTRAILDLAISLLDHRLVGESVYNGVATCFLAVLGIDTKSDTFKEAKNYTSFLSGFIKIAQLLVIQRAREGVALGEGSNSMDLIAKMQDRFMVFGSSSPLEWALKLRAYGRKIQENSTAFGYILWSDDGQTVGYRQTYIELPKLRWFIRDEVSQAQKQLSRLLFLSQDKDIFLSSALPTLHLDRLVDDPSRKTAGWSFLDDSRNDELQGQEKWLYSRVCQVDWISKEMLQVDRANKPKLKPRAIIAYLEKVNDFLKILLLIVHITSGQPARATELLTVQWCNPPNGDLRTIFVENGLVSMVTSCQKGGYSIENATKIIHRYLPHEVSELLIFYLWLVLPFTRQIQLVGLEAEQRMNTSTSFLWSRADGTSWKSERLTKVLEQEFREGLATATINTQIWRHLAIAISRRHMTQNGGKGFRRDYDLGTQRVADEQAGHNSFTAGNQYARLASMAPGWVESSQAEYRQISKQWHEVLGFGIFLPPSEKGSCTSSGLKRKLLHWSQLEHQTAKELSKKRVRINGRLHELEEPQISGKTSAEMEDEINKKAVKDIRQSLLASQFINCITKPGFRLHK